MNRRTPHARERVLEQYRPRLESARTTGRRRERNRRKPDLTGALRLLLVLALAGQTLRVAFASPRLRLQQVEVTGTSRYTPEEVIRRARVPIGRNIFAVNLVQVADRLREDPVVKEALVIRDLPNRLLIEIRERAPALRVVTPRGAYLADREGVVFEPAPPSAGALPTLELPAGTAPAPGRALHPEWVATVWRCVELARREGVALRTMRVDARGELWLNIATPPLGTSAPATLPVRFGRATELPDKFRAVRSALSAWPTLAQRVAWLDVMCPGSPAYRPAGEEGEATRGTRTASRLAR